jgi:hypothetical protein
MGFQRELASRGSLTGYISVCRSCLIYFHGENNSPALACVCCFFRVRRFSYNTDTTLYRWGDHNYERGHLCFGNILPNISTSLVLTSHQLTKQTTTRPATDTSVERGPPATYARDDDGEAR